MADEIFTQLEKEIGHQQKELERVESKLDANFAQLRLEIHQMGIDMRNMFKQLMVKMDQKNTAVVESVVEEPETVAEVGFKTGAQATMGTETEATIVTDLVEAAIVTNHIQIEEPSKLENEKSQAQLGNDSSNSMEQVVAHQPYEYEVTLQTFKVIDTCEHFEEVYLMVFVDKFVLANDIYGFRLLLMGKKIIPKIVEKFGVKRKLILQDMILNLYGLCGLIGMVSLLFDKMPQHDVVNENVMSIHLEKIGDLKSVYGFFLIMPLRNLRWWTMMKFGGAHCGKPKKGFELSMDMEESGMQANEVIVVIVLATCANFIVLKLGRNVRLLDSFIIVGKGIFKGKNGAKVHIPGANLNYITNKAMKSALASEPRLCVAKTCEVLVEFVDLSGYAMVVIPLATRLVPNQQSHFTGTYLGTVSIAFCIEIVESNDAYSFDALTFDAYNSVRYSLFHKKEKAIILQLDQVVLANGLIFGCVVMENFLKKRTKMLKHKNTTYENYQSIFAFESYTLKAPPKELLGNNNILFQHIQQMLSSETMLIAEEVVLKGWTHPYEQGKRWVQNMQSDYLPHEVASQFGMAQVFQIDCDYVLGHNYYHILAAGLNDYMKTTTLGEPVNKWRYNAAGILKLQTTTLEEPMHKWCYGAAGILKLQGLLLLQGRSHGDEYFDP